MSNITYIGDASKANRREFHDLLDKLLDALDRGDYTKADGWAARLLSRLGLDHLPDIGIADAMVMAGFGRMELVDTGDE